MTDSTENTYAIPSWNMAKLVKKIDSLNRRATKLGMPHIELVELGVRKVVAPGYEEKAKIMGLDWVPQITVHDVYVTGEGPKINGWKFLGTLDLITLPGSVIVNAVPGESVPVEFHTADGSCDHCGKIRRRNETFVLENEAGEHQMVGRQCVRDFIGYDVSGMLGQLTRLRTFEESLGDEDEWFGGGGGHWEYSFDKDRVLAATAAVIVDSGWVARSAAMNGERMATADLVMQVFNPPKFGTDREKAAYRAWIEKLDLQNEKFVADAAAAREWLKEQTTDNEYMHNLHVIDESASDDVPVKLFGYWCSLVSAYQRAQERLRVAALEKKLNEHVGNVKDRVDMEIKVVSKRYTQGYYNTVTIVRMIDTEGRTIVWFANTDVEMDEGDKYRIKGTIKKHDEYKGWKQTVVTRVKVLEQIEEAA